VSGVRVSAAKLDEDVQAFRRSLQGGDPRWKADSLRLYERLVKPIRARLVSQNVTIVAHGSLHYLPFNALHDGSQFMVERYSIRLLPAATVLKFLKASPGEKPGTLLAFGNPDLNDRRYELAFAQAEAQNIVRVLPKSRALTRGEATKTAFRKYATDFRMLHIASHGEFDPDRPLASALLLAPDAGSDGRLTVSDLYSMRVDADLVTLSACETGLGKVANGDDVVGLTRAFLYAGARTVIASLWQVDDKATGELMTSFYESLAKNAGKREALRVAQLRFLKKQPEPFFWAAFQLTGSP
jgi:CHAT domain-containing protein